MPSFLSKNEVENIRKLFAVHAAVTVVFSILTYCVVDQGWWLNFMISQFIVWVSISSLTFSVWLFFLKKNIALLTGVIVFKWPILGVLVYKMTEMVDLEALPFALGTLPIVLSSLLWSFLQKE